MNNVSKIISSSFDSYLYNFRYEIMSACWKVEPAERPSFLDIRESLLGMLGDREVCAQ